MSESKVHGEPSSVRHLVGVTHAGKSEASTPTFLWAETSLGFFCVCVFFAVVVVLLFRNALDAVMPALQCTNGEAADTDSWVESCRRVPFAEYSKLKTVLKLPRF